jgi:hypothetical protein
MASLLGRDDDPIDEDDLGFTTDSDEEDDDMSVSTLMPKKSNPRLRGDFLGRSHLL